jgi:outer membrane biosynthesis protein TonB
MDRSETLGLGIATAGHVLLLAALSLGLLNAPMPETLRPAPIDVELVDQVALESMARQSAPPPPSEAPEVGPTEEPAPAPTPAPTPAPAPTPPKPAPEPPKPKLTPAPAPKPAPPKPKPRPAASTPKSTSAPAKPTAKTAPAKDAGKGKASAAKGSRLGPDFLKDIEAESASARANPAPAAAKMGAADVRALNAEINRQIKPYWRPPSGADADKLVTLLSVHLDRDGAVVGRPELVDQQGVTEANRAQAALHAERAIQAVLRASPFQNLPPQYYEQWNWLKPLRFDARLAR